MIKLFEFINYKYEINENKKWIIIDFSAYYPKHIYVIKSINKYKIKIKCK